MLSLISFAFDNRSCDEAKLEVKIYKSIGKKMKRIGLT